jgi:nucleoside-diphosphate-sugar epimerase
MRILIIGGTSFIGLHAAGHAVAEGHEVTLFNRGQTNPTALPGVARMTGDRERPQDVAQLADRDWDAVLDTCGFEPEVVRLSSLALRGHVGHYTFVSSIAVYADSGRCNREDDVRLDLDHEFGEPAERAYGGSSLYGPMKARCEDVVCEAFPRVLIVRPTSVAGPLDHGASNRRTGYWAARVRDCDEYLVPRPRERAVSYIDVRDMARWLVGAADRGLTGTFNAAAPPITIEQFLSCAREVYASCARAVWADPEWLLAQGVRPNVELPWWVPEHPHLFAVDPARALEAGLRIRPLQETLRDSADWEDIRPSTLASQPRFAGQARGALMDRARELELIERWRARVGARVGVGAENRPSD